MKTLVINGALFLLICAAAISEAQDAELGSDELNLIVDSFERAGFDTRPLSPQADRQMPGSDYNNLVNESFRRAGMGGFAHFAPCSREQTPTTHRIPC
ncbi:hypothetical protein [uncultured Roseobacter sp.]|uniref:hypothetical protein n=1 Tax=uncultured Roseobacter sp. TaxID=114847 RepID=UPI00262E4551|nr:hypothetical protein [uncultured Roseobacter sp.]